MTYWDAKKGELRLQLRDPEKNYFESPALVAAQKGDTAAFFSYWKDHLQAVTHKNARGQNVLHVACKAGQAAFVEAVLDSKSDPKLKAPARADLDVAINAVDGQAQRLLHHAAGHKDVITVLLPFLETRDVKSIDRNKRAPLHRAATLGTVDSVSLLLELGSDVNAADANGRTALHCAALQGHCSVLEALIAAGASKDARDQEGLTPLHVASKHGRTDAVELLLDHGMNVLGTDTVTLLAADDQAATKLPALTEAKSRRGTSSTLVTKTTASSGGAGALVKRRSSRLGGNSAIDLSERQRRNMAFGGTTPPITGALADPLEMAAKRGNMETVQALQARGALISCVGIHRACQPKNEFCYQCWFRQQWITGNRREKEDGPDENHKTWRPTLG